ncbi:DUF4114 domain-containing protein [Zunongwangia sp.]|uniref:DUF4114 domain-containing protein n=1 Tax=Zunongwangia sp. TaxID=1965325 RepID=UPI003AA9E18D
MKQKLLLLFSILSFNLYAQDYQFLGTYTADGVPNYLDGRDKISAETIQMINDALPEGYPVPDYNPHYISAGYDTDIVLDKDADVWVTFVQEGAGYKNVLGFYTYDSNKPQPSKPTPEEITIIFPNVSAQGSGGGLLVGDKVKIGRFTAGTGIGWVLLANGWKNGAVTSGHWQVFSNPDYNPESDPDLKPHNVLLADEENERIILGFEDIRRDYSSCDQDFNDALFYVTANPYDAIRTENFVDVKSATDVSSANDGGLESNGDLARLIAKRNFNRIKNNSFKNTKSKQVTYKAQSQFIKNSQVNLESLLPETGMFGSERAYESSPEDLLAITNATEIFSVDYYQDQKRVAAALASHTEGSIYDHSKVICDRLNGSSLEDIRTIKLAGHRIIMIKVLRRTGQLEYALNFSIQMNAGMNTLFSYWNIGDYPKGNYANFQVWGGTMGQVSTIAKHIIESFTNTQGLKVDNQSKTVPGVFVKQGIYKNGKIHLKLRNNSNASLMQVTANARATELAAEETFQQNIALQGNYEEEVILNIGGIFDAGLEIQAEGSQKTDALYLADGPWGIDYNESETKISEFELEASEIENSDAATYHIERNAKISGDIYGTLNIFRNILPGDLSFYPENFEAIAFNLQHSVPVEVILVSENLTDWDKRYRYTIESSENTKAYNIRLTDFKNDSGQFDGKQALKGIVFSVKGDYKQFKTFTVNVADVKFTDFIEIPQNEKPIAVVETPDKKAYNYPNPFRGSTNLVLPKSGKQAKVTIFDMGGRVVHQEEYVLQHAEIEVPLQLHGVSPGMYHSIIKVDNNDTMNVRLIIK